MAALVDRVSGSRAVRFATGSCSAGRLVRALVALRLVLVFVCLAGFLYNEVNNVITPSNADDIGKQMFTNSGDFVNAISFCFSSRATSSGVGVGARAAKDGGEGSEKSDPQSAVAEAKAPTHLLTIHSVPAVDRGKQS